MKVFNVFGEQDWDGENDRAGYRHRAAAIGKRLGATLLGGTLYELPPGEKSWPYRLRSPSGPRSVGRPETAINHSSQPTS